MNSLAVVINPANQTVHMLHPVGDRSLCGHFDVTDAGQIYNEGGPDLVSCFRCQEAMWDNVRKYQSRRLHNRVTLLRVMLAFWEWVDANRVLRRPRRRPSAYELKRRKRREEPVSVG